MQPPQERRGNALAITTIVLTAIQIAVDVALLRSDMIEHLGYDDWKNGAWYLVHVVKRGSSNGKSAISR